MEGTTLSHYRIIKKLGAGGMGEVYLAEDTRLKRQVALKILTEDLRHNPEWLKRFQIEAEAAAKLNHPNIATIYSVEEVDDQIFIIMEYVEGKLLGRLIPKNGLDLNTVFGWFIPLADALNHAHEKGVTHRDIKPGNIMVTPEGVPKILDFGLARMERQQPATVDSEISTETLTEADQDPSEGLTKPGQILGTPAYLSPEQAEGKPVDYRSDIFSFGVVMYEVLTGQRPFTGEAYVSIISSIIKDEPESVTALKPEIPYIMARLVRRCLQKDLDDRYQTAKDVRNELKELKWEIDTGVVGLETGTGVQRMDVPVSRWQRAVSIAAMVMLSLVIGILIGWYIKPSSEPPLRKFQLPLAVNPNPYNGPVISPDGTMVAFSRGGRLWIRDLAQVELQELTDTPGAERPFWSPNSAFVGYFVVSGGKGGSLRKVSVQGGPSIPLCALPEGYPRGATWNTAGVIVFGMTRGGINTSDALFEVSAQGGNPRLLIEPDSTRGELGLIYPSFLPDKRTLLFAVARPDGAGALVVQEGARRRSILPNPGECLAFPVYSPSGHIVYQRGFPTSKGIWAVPFSLAELAVTGEPFRVVSQGSYPGVSEDGTLVYLPTEGAGQLVWVDRSGRIEGRIGQPQEEIDFPAISPDGHRVAFSAVQQGNMNIWIYELDRGTRPRLTFDPGFNGGPVWSSDGDWIAFTSMRSGAGDIYRRAANGSGEPQPLVTGSLLEVVSDWSRDGHYLLYYASDPNTGLDLWYLPLWVEGDRVTADGEPVAFLQTAYNEGFAVFSPDGRYVAYQSDESGRYEIHVRTFPDRKGQWHVSLNGGKLPRWRGDELFYVEGNTLMAVPVETQPVFRAGSPQRLFVGEQIGTVIGQYDVTTDGQRFVVIPPLGEGAMAMTIVQNWFAEFRK